MVYKGALIGFGQVAEKAHVPAFLKSPGFQLVAAVDASEERLAAARALIPGLRTYASLDALLAAEKGLDFVDLATPPFMHAQQAEQALAAGLNVLCEKPLALSASELSRIEAAAQAGKVVFTVHNWKHAPLLAKAQELVAAKAIGAVSHAEWHTLRREPAKTALDNWRSDPVRSGGGILVDHGWHALYLVFGWLGQPATRVSALLKPAGAEREATVFLECGDATGLIRLSWNAPARSNWGAIHGSEGSLELLDDELILRRADRTEKFSFPEKISQGSAHPEWFQGTLSDFADELAGSRRGRNLAEARFCLDVMTRAYELAKESLPS
jgi:predicted dehydrogenase